MSYHPEIFKTNIWIMQATLIYIKHIDYHTILFIKLVSQIYTFLNDSYRAWRNIIGNDANVIDNKNISIIGNIDKNRYKTSIHWYVNVTFYFRLSITTTIWCTNNFLRRSFKTFIESIFFSFKFLLSLPLVLRPFTFWDPFYMKNIPWKFLNYFFPWRGQKNGFLVILFELTFYVTLCNFDMFHKDKPLKFVKSKSMQCSQRNAKSETYLWWQPF